MLAERPRIPLTVLIAVLFIALQVQRVWRDPAGKVGRRHAALAMLALYGLISCASLLGVFVVGYIQPCIHVLLLIGALEADRLLQARDPASGRWAAWTPNRILAVIGGAAVLAMVRSPMLASAFFLTVPHIVADHLVRGKGIQWEGIWPSTLLGGHRVIDARRGLHGELPAIWSTYAGLVEGQYGAFNPSSFDYIIHALGPKNRAAYVERFRAVRPRLVQTVLPKYMPYEIHVEQTSWDFYAELLQNYRVIDSTPWSIFWERLPLPGAAPMPFWSVDLVPGSNGVDVPAPPPNAAHTSTALMQIEVEYLVRNPLGILPVIGALPRYLIRPTGALIDGSVSLDPFTTVTRFPVIVAKEPL